MALPAERVAYLVCRTENKDRTIFLFAVPEPDADWLADGLQKIPETFNLVRVIKKPDPRKRNAPV